MTELSKNPDIPLVSGQRTPNRRSTGTHNAPRAVLTGHLGPRGVMQLGWLRDLGARVHKRKVIQLTEDKATDVSFHIPRDISCHGPDMVLKKSSGPDKKMQKVWFYEEYGPKEVLSFGDFPIPTPTKNQLLVQVHAAALNPIDFKLRNMPLAPLDFPVVPGCDMSGIVVEKHDQASRFKVGDHVYGNIQDFKAKGKLKQLGSLAQFVAVAEDMVAEKPKNVSFEEAASLPLAVQTVVEAFKTGGFQEGESVFIVGGAGGVGSMAVQLAKHVYRACLVGASTSGGKVNFVKALGADKVMDYTHTHYGEIEDKYDLVIDTVGDSKNSYVVGKETAPIVDITWPPSNPRAIHSSLTVSGEILDKLNPFLESGKVKAVIDPKGPYHLCDVFKAFEHLETGRAKGKVVIFPFTPETYSLQHVI
ncbi:hypothetical protein F511_15378 [Dorcoceras hygrometricum]|uniref:Enoyl reductase (ER) domain-containing protein n=1 Tax=Dorcoceras hygrometricum TaxID=472368 RepID=A0A2Z7C550_9LAMI|nr:hypothetical protein F511_15378 [Dorcoceras hygrometricum]